MGRRESEADLMIRGVRGNCERRREREADSDEERSERQL
jgi:hypothetical protein